MARKATTKRTAAAPRKRKAAAAPGLAHRAVSATGSAIARNPTLVGGSTAFLVAMFFVSANALWYQPHLHGGAFFQTRNVPSILLPPQAIAVEPESLDDETSLLPPEPVDQAIAQVQGVLQELRLYRGPVDGVFNADTQEAVETYQRIVGQTVTGEVDGQLLALLGIPGSTASIAPTPAPRASSSGPVPASARMADGEALPAGERIRRIQAGLRAFGNEAVEVDGVMGAKTRAGIQEFQSLFGLAVTGEPDEDLYAKMREIGLTN